MGLFNMFAGEALTGGAILLLLLASAWTLAWKGIGLWHSGRGSQKGWFVVMLIFNTMGLLPIIYLIWFKKQPLGVKSVGKPKVVSKKKPAKKRKKK